MSPEDWSLEPATILMPYESFCEFRGETPKHELLGRTVLIRNGEAVLTDDLPPPRTRERDALIEWAKQACNRLARSKNQINDGRDLRHAEALMPILKAEINRPKPDLTPFLHELPNILVPLQARAAKGEPPSEEQMDRLWKFNDNLRALHEGREPDWED